MYSPALLSHSLTGTYPARNFLSKENCVLKLSESQPKFGPFFHFQQFLKQRNYEAKYNIDLVEDPNTGKTTFVDRPKDEVKFVLVQIIKQHTQPSM
jgi:hypothetical protein